MPKQISEQEFAAIVIAVNRRPDGIGISDIRKELSISLPTRTLQRRLQRLEEEGRITKTGIRKGTRYYPAGQQSPAPKPAPVRVAEPEADESELPLSPASRELRKAVRAPVFTRIPAGYRSEFLGSYIPNKTAYLPEETRAELAQSGRVGVTNLPAGTYIRQVLDRLLIDLSWNSSRLEGNTYSMLETERLLELGEGDPGHTPEETQMILNHKAAIEMLAEQAEEIGFNRYTICNLHALLSDNLLPDPTASGRLRSCAVGIGGSVFHPLEGPQRVEAKFLEILEKAEAIHDPFEQAFFGMVHLPYLQPFEDVNKRVSRLAANIPLVKYNLCPLSFIDVPQDDYIAGLLAVYELNRIEYLRDVFVWAYRRSAVRYPAVVQSLGEPDPFRLRYRTQIGELVRGVVLARMDKSEAVRWIANQAEEKMEKEHRAQMAEVVERELGGLHEGNIARYRLRPGEFAAWYSTWR